MIRTLTLLYPLDAFYAEAGRVIPRVDAISGEEAPEPYRRLLSPAVDPAGAVISLGRATDALTVWARQLGIPFEAEDLDAFL